MDGYVSKPINLAAILEEIASVIDTLAAVGKSPSLEF
jgi:hypothetical protein